MAEPQYSHSIDGQEVEEADLNILGQNGLIDDRVLAEFLRLAPFSSAAAKAIIPFGHLAVTSATTATVQSSGSANGSVKIMPFRAIVGSRTTVAGSNPLTNWRDIRSGIYCLSSDGTTLGTTLLMGANGTLSPRWDLIYAIVTPDTNGASVTRQVKSPGTLVVAPQSVVTTLVCTVTIGVVAGTVSNTFPTLPGDAGGAYNIPLAYVRIPNGFGAASTISALDVYEVLPTVPIAREMGGSTLQVANQSNAQGGTVLSSTGFPWVAGAGLRPAVYLPPSMTGGTSLFWEMALDGLSAANSHPSAGGIIDSSQDWRNRFFRVFVAAVATGGNGFAQDKASGSTAASRIPAGGAAVNAYFWQISQSFTGDAAATAPHSISAGSSIVAHLTSVQLAPMRGTSLLVIYVDGVDGKLKCDYDTTGPQAKFFFWIDATAPMSNY